LYFDPTERIVVDNDAKSCYATISSGVALTALRGLVHSRESVKMLGLTWAQMEHRVSTDLGVSDKI
jgi:hypothetical protein